MPQNGNGVQHKENIKHNFISNHPLKNATHQESYHIRQVTAAASGYHWQLKI